MEFNSANPNSNISDYLKNSIIDFENEEYLDNMNLKDIEEWDILKENGLVNIVYKTKDYLGRDTTEEYTDYDDYVNKVVKEELSKEFSPVGKTAKVHTLKPSKVWPLKDLFDYSINKTYFWDGEKIIITFSNKSQELTNIDTLTFTPKEDYLVEIIDEDSVTPMTEFVQPKK